MSAHLLLVEDDLRLQSVIRRGLEAEGYAVDVAGNGAEALERTLAQDYALIVLDRMMPGQDGVEVCRALRERGCSSLILMLTARDTVQDRIDGLRGGADDYLVKPFAFDEVLARIEALLRRQAPLPPVSETLELADLVLDPVAKTVTRGGRKVALTRKEFGLLELLMRRRGEVVGREALLSEIWNLSFDPGTKVLEVHISFLRRKIDDGEALALIRTIRGFGYMVSDAP